MEFLKYAAYKLKKKNWLFLALISIQKIIKNLYISQKQKIKMRSRFFKSFTKTKLLLALGLSAYGTSHIFTADSSHKSQKKGSYFFQNDTTPNLNIFSYPLFMGLQQFRTIGSGTWNLKGLTYEGWRVVDCGDF